MAAPVRVVDAHATSADPYRTSRPLGVQLEGDLPLPRVVTGSGTTLPVRLLRAFPRATELGGLGAVTVLWNLGVALGILLELQGNQLLLGLMLIPLAIIGAGLIATLVTRLRLHALREPCLELDSHPLRQGARHMLSLVQHGPLRMGTLAVELRGVEAARRSSGHTHHFTREFFALPLLREEGLDLVKGEVWSRRVELPLPRDLPSSFAVPNGSLRYELVVRTTTSDVREADENIYPVLVLPLPARGGLVSDVGVSLASTRVPAGGWLRGSVSVSAPLRAEPFVLSVLWSTSGQGSPDERVIHRQELPGARGRVPFEVKVPLTPTSYDGDCLKIVWRVRVSLAGSTVHDAPFEVAARV